MQTPEERMRMVLAIALAAIEQAQAELGHPIFVAESGDIRDDGGMRLDEMIRIALA